jgi:hypothetical protein
VALVQSVQIVAAEADATNRSEIATIGMTLLQVAKSAFRRLYVIPWMVDAGAIRRRFGLIEKHLDERMRRLVAAAEAVGVGGVSLVARATGVSCRAIRVGARELKERQPLTSDRIRRRGLGASGRSSRIQR